MDYQDYESLAGPSPVEYTDSYPNGFEVHRTFQQPSRSQQTSRNLQPLNSQQLWNALPKEVQEILKNCGSRDNPAPASRNPYKIMAKFHDHHLVNDSGSNLDPQDMHPADLIHDDFVGEQESDVMSPEPDPNEDAQPLLAFLSNQKKLAPNDSRHVLSPPKPTS